MQKYLLEALPARRGEEVGSLRGFLGVLSLIVSLAQWAAQVPQVPHPLANS